METIEEKIVTIARYPYNRAILLQSRLLADDIDCFLSHQNLLQPAVSTGVELKVRKSDVEKALRLIDEFKSESGKGKEKALSSIRSIRRILVPIDFSAISHQALNFALDLALLLKSEIKLLHVYYNPVIDIAPYDTGHSYQVNLSHYLHEIEQNARKQIIDLVEATKKKVKDENHKIKITCSLINGLPDEEILNYSKKYKPGLIVMGSRGLGNQSTGMIGSITAKIIKKSNIPIIAIPENSTVINTNKIKNVLYATDYDPYDQIALSKLINLIYPLDVTLHIVHISLGVLKSWDKIKMENLENFLKTEYEKYKIKCKILVSDDIINGLEAYMRDNEVEVIAMTSHSRNLINNFFTPSVTKQVMKRISRPLFVFKASSKL